MENFNDYDPWEDMYGETDGGIQKIKKPKIKKVKKEKDRTKNKKNK